MLEIRAIANSINVIRGSEPRDGISVLRGARGERVSCQFIVKSDLPGKATFNVNADGNETRVYFETFVPVTVPSRCDFKKGEYADGLIELDRAEKLGLTDFEADKTYAFTVFVTLPTDGKNFGLTAEICVGEESEAVSIPVIPYDFDMPAVNHSRTCYMVWRDCHRLLGTQVEQDKKYEDLCEMLLDFRLSPYIIPYSWESVDEFIARAKVYAADNRVGAYSITYRTKREKTIYDDNQEVVDLDYLRATLRAMVENSTDELNLFEKAYIHYTFIDEPTPATYHAVERCHKETYDIIREVAQSYDFSDKPEVERALLTLCDIVTAWDNEKLYSRVDTFCPFYDSEFMPEYVYENKQTELLGRKRWWYGCNAPKSPYPNHHTDSPVVDSRVEPWMRFYHNVIGELYWSVNSNHPYDEKSGKYAKDLLDDPHVMLDVNGEGMLIYTGTRYGDPFPTLRLNATCEGQKDYEYLLLLERLCEQNCDFYETRLGVREMLRDLFLTLFDSTCNLSDAARMDEAKEEIAGRIELGLKGVFVYGNGKTATVYAPDNAEVSIRGARIASSEKAGSGKKLVFETSNEESFIVECDGKRVKMFSRASENIDLSALNKSDSAIFPPYVANYWSNPENAVYFTVPRKIESNKVRVSDYRGGKKIDCKPFVNTVPPVLRLGCNKDFSSVTHLCFDVCSHSNRAFVMQFNLIDECGNKYEAGYEIVAPGENAVRVAINRLAEKRINALYDYASIWMDAVMERQKKALAAFSFDKVRSIEIVLLNYVALLDDNRERRADEISAIIYNASTEKRNVKL